MVREAWFPAGQQEHTMKQKAYFFLRPRRASELNYTDPAGRWMEYRIVAQIRLNKIDYENFCEDLLADRQFIEDHYSLCQNAGDCLLVSQRGRSDGLLIIPYKDCFVRYAAKLPTIQIVD